MRRLTDTCLAWGISWVFWGMLSLPAQGAAFTWDGGSAVDSNWSTANNWVKNVSPSNDGTAGIVMAGLVRLTPNVDAAWSILSLTFDNTSGAFTLDGSALTIGSGGVDNNDADMQTVSNAITLGASQTWNANAGILIFNGSVNNNGHLLNVTGSNNTNISAAISGTGGLTKDGTGTMTFSYGATNTYSGTTTVNSGRLYLNRTSVNGAIRGDLVVGDGAGGADADVVRLWADDQILSTPGNSVTVTSSGLLDFNGYSDSVYDVVLEGGHVTTGAGSLILGGSLTTNGSTQTALIEGHLNIGSATKSITINSGGLATDLEIRAAISNSAAGAGINITGPGTMRFTGSESNTYNGLTTVSNADLVLFKDSGGAIAGNLLVQNNGRVHSNAWSDNQIADTSDVTVRSGLFEMTSVGANDTIHALTLGGEAGSATVDTDLNTLTLGSDVTYDAAGSATATISGKLSLGNANRTFIVNNGANNEDLSIDAVISADAGNVGLSKNGAGRLVFRGASSNTYTGLTTVSDGYLRLDKTAAAVAIAGNLTIQSRAWVNYGAGGGTNQIADTSQVIVRSGRLDLWTNNASDTIGALTLGGDPDVPMGSSAEVWTGLGTLTLGGDVLYDAANSAFAVIEGHLNLGAATRTFYINDGANADDLWVQAFISGAGGVGLIKDGTGTMTLIEPNNYSGSTTIRAGVLKHSTHHDVLPTSTTVTIGNSPGTSLWDLNNLNQTVAGITFHGTDSNNTTLASITTGTAGTGTLTLNGNLTVNSAASPPQTATIIGNLDLGGATRSFNVNSNLDIWAVIGNGGLAVSGNSTLTLKGASGNTYTGLTQVLGSVQVTAAKSAGNAIPGNLSIATTGGFNSGTNQIADSSAVTVTGLWNLSGTETINRLTASGASAQINGGGTLTIAGNQITSLSNGASVAANLVTGSGSLDLGDQVSITGNVTLGGNLRYLGTTNQAIVGGNLNLGGPTRNFEIADGAASVDLQIDGIISNGGITKTGNGVLRLQGVNSYSGATTVNTGVLELNSLGQLNVDSAIANSAEFRIDGGTHTVGTIAGGGTTRLISGGALTAASLVQGTLIIGAGSRLTIQPATAAGTATPVPEPATPVLLIVGMLFALISRLGEGRLITRSK